MKVKDLFKNIECTNKLQQELQSRERASVQIYVDDISIGHECHDLQEFKHYLKNEYVDEFIKIVEDVHFTKTYNNTLSATIYCNNVMHKVDLFVDMGGF